MHPMIYEQSMWNMMRFMDFLKPLYEDMVSKSSCVFNKVLNPIIRWKVTIWYGIFTLKIGKSGVYVEDISNEEFSR